MTCTSEEAAPPASPARPTRRGVLAAAAVATAAGLVWWAAVGWPGRGPAGDDTPPDAPPVRPAEPPVRPRGDEIVLGMSAPFTGPNRKLGLELYRGSVAYFEDFNRHGGAHGRPVSIRAYDDGYNPGPAIDNTVRLIEQDDVFLLFDYVGTPTTTRCLPLLKQCSDRSVFLFCPFTGAQPQRQRPYDEVTFNLRASYYQETAGLVDHFVAVGRRRVAVLYQIDAYGRTGWEGVRAALARHQLAMTGEATYRRGAAFEESFRPQVDILRGTAPDAVVCIGSYAAGAAFIRDARAAGWDVPVANISFAASDNMLARLLAAGQAAGVDYTRNLVHSQVVPSYTDQTIPAVREFHELMARYGPLPPTHLLAEEYRPAAPGPVALEGFLNAKLLAAVLTKMGPPFDRHRVKAAAESVRDLDLGIGVPASFSPARHQALDQVYYTTVRGGRFEPLTDWEEWRK